MNNLSETLEWKKIGEIFDVKDGTHDSPKYVNSDLGYPLVTSKNIKNSKLILDNCNYISKKDYDKINQRSKVDINDIIMPMIGTIGNPYLILEEPNYAIKNVALFKPKKDLSDFLLYWLKSDFIKRKFLNDAKGGTQKFVSLKYLRELPIPLPTLTKQKKIAQTLDKVQELITLRKNSIEKLDDLAKSLFIDMFGDPVSNPMNWNKEKLGKLSEVKTGKTPSRKEPLYWDNGTENWATTTEVNKIYINGTEELITEYAITKCNLSIYPINTILMAMYGQGKTRGNVALLATKSTINQAFAAILPSKNINQKYLFNLLKNIYSFIRSLGRGGNQENLNLEIVKNLEIILPPITIQNKFVKSIEKIEEQKVLYEEELKKLQESFDSLLQRSFS